MHSHAHIHQIALQRRQRTESKENRLTLICISPMHLYCADLYYARTHTYLLEDGHTRDPRGRYCLTLFCIQTVYRFPLLRRMRVYARGSEWVRESRCVSLLKPVRIVRAHSVPGGGVGGGGHEWTSSVVQSDSSFLDASTVSCTDCERGRKRGNDRGRGLEGRECA